MNSYIVRIYRREPAAGSGRRAQDAPVLTGTVEDPDSGVRTGFHGIEELWAILGGTTRPADSQHTNRE
ncbi:MAG TPA: hypothetical protein VGA00_06850 [Acidiferrobacterales bacterium]